MYDGLFFVNHALNGTLLSSVYNEKQRYHQTLETIESINKYCPNNKIFIFDSSPNFPKKEYVQSLIDRDVSFFYTAGNLKVYDYSSKGWRSIAECISFQMFIKWFKSHRNLYKAKRIYKLSGRYRLNDNFILDDEKYKNAFVFAKSVEPHLRNDSFILPNWYLYGSKKYYQLRLWHMDYNLLDTFELKLEKILSDCIDHKVDIEHVYYRHLHTYKTIELDKIGVCGNIAPSGIYIDE